MARPKLEVADICRRYGEAYRQQHDGSLLTAQRRVMAASAAASGSPPGSAAATCNAEAGRFSGSVSRQRKITRSIKGSRSRSEEHTSELQSRLHLVCRL